MTESTQTPAQAEKLAAQKDWDDQLEAKFDKLTMKYPDPANHAETSAFYRELYAMRANIELTGPALKKKYNVAIETLFGNYDALPAALFIDDSVARP